MSFLKTTTIAVESVVIATCALAAFQIATARGGDIIACLPILTIAVLEALRVPVAMRLPTLKPIGAAIGVILLVAITPLTFEGMSLAFEQFMHQRVLAVAKAQETYDEASRARDSVKEQEEARKQQLADLTQQVRAAEQHRVDIAKQTVPLLPVPKAQMCKNGRTGGTYECRNGAIAAIVAANVNAQTTHTRDLEAAEVRVKERSQALEDARGKPGPDSGLAEASFNQARRNLEIEKSESVMHRAAAAWFGVAISDLSVGQFETFKKWAMYGLAGATAVATMLAAFVSTAPLRDGSPGKLTRMLRATLAARRKKLRRIAPTVVTEYRDREVFVHVPVDAATGQILDRKPDLHVVGVAAE